MKPWLTILGIGDDGVEGLAPPARALLDQAQIVVGSQRILEGTDLSGKETHVWPSPLETMLAQIKEWKDRGAVVLATGDPMHYGIGATFAAHIPANQMIIIPAPSAFSLAAARLGWAVQDVETISLHGRHVSILQPFIQPGAKILALTSGRATVHEVAAILRARGFGDSPLTVLEHMGGPYERNVTLAAKKYKAQDFAEFNTLGIDCVASPEAKLLPAGPGLPDDAYIHDGQLTKREMRAITLAALGPVPGALLWDVGAGCGSVAIEWMRAAQGTRAIAFEKNEARVKMIAQNAVALGAPELEVVAGDAAPALKEQPTPSAIFLGGGVADGALFKTCWRALPPDGRLVANAVTLEGEAALISRQETHGGEIVRVDVSHLAKIGSRRILKPRMAVTQWRASKARTR